MSDNLRHAIAYEKLLSEKETLERRLAEAANREQSLMLQLAEAEKDAGKWRFLHLEAEEPLSCQMCRNAHDAVLKKLDEKEHRLIEAEKQLEQKHKQVEELQRECDNFERQILYTETEKP